MPAGLAIVFALGFCGLFTALAVLDRSQGHQPREAQAVRVRLASRSASPRGRYSVKFYQVAILFLVFDIEAAFMYPWAVLYSQLSHDAGDRARVSVFGFAEMLRVRRDPRRRARLRLEKEGDRMGVELTTTRLEDAAKWAKQIARRARDATGDASSRCSSTRSSPRAAAWSSCRVAGAEVRHRALRRRVPALLAAPERPAHGRRHDHREAGPGAQARLRADGRAEVGHRLRRVRVDRRLLPELLTRCRAPIRSSPSTSTSPAARRVPSRCSTR